MFKFSIIIPARSYNEYLKESLENILKMDYKNYDVIVVLDIEPSVQVITDEKILYLYSGEKGPGEKRNLAAQKSDSEYLAFLDDDAYPRKDWLQNAEKVLAETDSIIIGGPAITPLNAYTKEFLSGKLLESSIASGFTKFRNTLSSNRKVDDYPSVNLIVKREAFNFVGGYPSNFWPGEDTKFCLDLVKRHGKILYVSDVVVYHHRRPIFKPVLKQISRYAKQRGMFTKKFPQNSRKFAYYIPSIFLSYLLSILLVYLIAQKLITFYLVPLIFYLILVLIESLILSKKYFHLLYIGIILVNLVYGFNFIKGLIFETSLELRKYDKDTGQYIDG